MAYVHTAVTVRDVLTTEPKTGATTGRRPGLLRRIVAAMQEARLRQAEREIAIYLTR
jgi:hypothetical protein